MRISLSREVWGGVGVAALGAFLVWEASRYPFGSLTSAGAGFFPLVFSVILLGLGVVMIVESVAAERMHGREETGEEPLAIRSLVAISAAILAFALTLNQFGLVPATVALVVISAFAERQVRPLRMLLTAVVLSILAVVIFIHGFQLPLQSFRWG